MAKEAEEGKAQKGPCVPPPRYDHWSLTDILKAEFPENDWILDKLIHSGDQVELAGPPKIGKSTLGIQLALTVALGKGHFLSED